MTILADEQTLAADHGGDAMTDTTIRLEVRTPRPGCSVIELAGEVTGASEAALSDAYERAATEGTRAVVLDFERPAST